MYLDYDKSRFINIELDDGTKISTKLLNFTYLYRGLKNYYIKVEDTGNAWKASYQIDGMMFYSVNRSIEEALEDIIKGIASFEKDPNYRKRIQDSENEEDDEGEEILY